MERSGKRRASQALRGETQGTQQEQRERGGAHAATPVPALITTGSYGKEREDRNVTENQELIGKDPEIFAQHLLLTDAY
ncbi:hypothetical protein E5288_WYG013035 [Bos mutus]|uniref:Uncharacterized protein n=1 Tax=Bos mutus TaxID=72004 RepID=A0A6B0R9T9_9CETA|nr:hypothetical protein [Bos mutus]